MATEHATPWDDDCDWKNFRDSCVHIKKNFELAPDAPSTPVNLDDLVPFPTGIRKLSDLT